MASAQQEMPPDQATLRRVLDRLFSIDADQDAFFLDYFPTAYQRTASSCDRKAKTNLLFQLVTAEAIWGVLCRHYQEQLKNVADLLPEQSDTPGARQLERQRAELRRLLDAQATCQSFGIATDELRTHITRAQRELRHGRQVVEQDILQNRYLLLERLGRGGVSTVWMAQDRASPMSAHEIVAVKVLLGQHAEDPSCVRRFERGARQMAMLRHPSIVRVLDGPFKDDALHFFVLEYVPNGDLREAVERRAIRDVDAILVVRQIGAALQFAHDSKLIHRDVTPSNILLGTPGPAKLTDFDLVLPKDHSTLVGRDVQGTLAFAAPELLDGGSAEAFDPRLDVYSLGMTTLFCLTGRQVPIMRRSQLVPRLIEQLPYGDLVKNVLLTSLAEQPEDRFPRVEDFCTELAVAWERHGSWPQAAPSSSTIWVEDENLSEPYGRLPQEVAPQTVPPSSAVLPGAEPASETAHHIPVAHLSQDPDGSGFLSRIPWESWRRWAPGALLLMTLSGTLWLSRERWYRQLSPSASPSHQESIVPASVPPLKDPGAGPPRKLRDESKIPPLRTADEVLPTEMTAALKETPEPLADGTSERAHVAAAAKPSRTRSGAQGVKPSSPVSLLRAGPVSQQDSRKAVEFVSLGRKDLDSGDFARAEQSFLRATELDPSNSEAQTGLGESLFQQGSLEKAAIALDRAVRLDPRRKTAHELLAMSQYKLGRNKDAAQTCKLILSKWPENTRAKRILDQMPPRDPIN